MSTFDLHTLAAATLAVACAAPCAAQTLDSGSTGADGALELAPDRGDVRFDPTTFVPPLDPDGDGVYHFTTITIGAGTRLLLRGSTLGDRPVVWLAQGLVRVEGTLDLSVDISTGEPGAGGHRGGLGGEGGIGATIFQGSGGDGPGGGQPGNVDEDPFDGIDPQYAESGSFAQGGRRYGNALLLPLVGGSGGGGQAGEGTDHSDFPGLTGGGSGGALLLASSVEIRVTGAIRANGSGNRDRFFNLGPLGTGGAIRLVAPSLTGAGRVEALGPFGQVPGRIRLESFATPELTNVGPTPSVGRPAAILPPAAVPSIRVVSVGGATPAPHTRSDVADVRAGGSVVVALEARNVPPGTVVRLRVVTEREEELLVTSTPLSGTVGLSTATATFTVPSKLARVFVTAGW